MAAAVKKKTTKTKTKTKRKTKAEKLKEQTDEFFSSVKPTPEYVKHLVECRCSLAHFREWDDPPNHKFIVFSELDSDANLKPSYAKCNNCSIIHKVQEVGQSFTIKKEEMRSLPTIEDLEGQMQSWITSLLRKHDCELHVWQEAKFIIDNKLWGRFIILAKEREDDVVIGKLCQILGKNLHKIESYEQDESWVEEEEQQ